MSVIRYLKDRVLRLVKGLVARTPYFLYRIRTREKMIALTFDDGPHRENTLKLLGILQETGVKATFFVVGKQAHEFPDLITGMLRGGHEVANHSYFHDKNADLVEGVEKTENEIIKIAGKSSRLFRPPWGRLTASSIVYCLLHKIRIVLWSFDSQDYMLTDPRKLAEYIKQAVILPGDVILFHEDYSYTLTALPEIISILKQKGFIFNTVSELWSKRS
ncbi:MAG: polysaccharide deacetylase family protein [Candidatus Omnitrophota bacterium]